MVVWPFHRFCSSGLLSLCSSGLCLMLRQARRARNTYEHDRGRILRADRSVLRDLGSVPEDGEEFRQPPLDVLRYHRRPVRLGWVPWFGWGLSVLAVVRQPVDIGLSAADYRKFLTRLAMAANGRFPPWGRGRHRRGSCLGSPRSCSRRSRSGRRMTRYSRRCSPAHGHAATGGAAGRDPREPGSRGALLRPCLWPRRRFPRGDRHCGRADAQFATLRSADRRRMIRPEICVLCFG